MNAGRSKANLKGITFRQIEESLKHVEAAILSSSALGVCYDGRSCSAEIFKIMLCVIIS